MAKRRELSVRDTAHDALPLPAPPLVCGEDAATYDQLAARIAAAVAPANVIADGEFALVPDGGGDAGAGGGPA